MCGIGGLYRPGLRPLERRHREALDRLSDAIEARGPDAKGEWFGPGIGLTHRRLSIIDPQARSDQPIESEDWVLCYNGEIYNFQDIRRTLISYGYQFETTGDTEVLLMAIQEWGVEGAVVRLAGMFAFLAYCKRDGVLYAVRDPLGIKPLLFTRTEEGGYCFASSVTGIQDAFPDRDWAPYAPALASFFTLGAPFTRGCAVSGIERIEPAQCVKFTPDGLFERSKYWSPRYQSDFTMDDLASIVAEYEISDVKSALFLSGGVDSTYLASVTKTLDFFHLVSPERHYAQAVADRFKREMVSVEPEIDDYEAMVRTATRFHGEPMMSCGIPLSVSRAIVSKGYKMAISANGADELFHGYPRTPIPEHQPDYLPLHEIRTYKWFSQQVAHIFRDSRNFSIPEVDAFMPALSELANDALDKYRLDDFPPSASHRWFELMTYVLHDLNPTLDAASMANSLEVRVPFLDHRVVEGVLSWDGARLVTPELGRKAPLKQALLKYFPASFFHRPKLGFSIHSDSLTDIANLGVAALEEAKQTGALNITSKPDRRYGEYARDMIYLGSSLYAYKVWREEQEKRRVADASAAA